MTPRRDYASATRPPGLSAHGPTLQTVFGTTSSPREPRATITLDAHTPTPYVAHGPLRPLPFRPVGSAAAKPLWFGASLLLAERSTILAIGVQRPTRHAAGARLRPRTLRLHTPLKRRTTLATFVGGVSRRRAALIGWRPRLGNDYDGMPESCSLFLFFCNSAFRAISWVDPGRPTLRGGNPVLSVADHEGPRTFRPNLFDGVLLIPVILLPP